MRLSARLAALVGLLAIVLPPVNSAAAADAADVIPAWERAFNAGDADAIAALYTAYATLFGTLSPSLTASPDALKAYFAGAARNRLSVKLLDTPTATKISDAAVVFAGLYEFSGTRDGQAFSLPARYSFVVVNDSGQWRIAHQHSSPRAKPQ